MNTGSVYSKLNQSNCVLNLYNNYVKKCQELKSRASASKGFKHIDLLQIVDRD